MRKIPLELMPAPIMPTCKRKFNRHMRIMAIWQAVLVAAVIIGLGANVWADFYLDGVEQGKRDKAYCAKAWANETYCKAKGY